MLILGMRLKKIYGKIFAITTSKINFTVCTQSNFYHSKDADWVAAVPAEQLHELYVICQFNSLYESEHNFEIKEILYGLEVLVQRITGRAMETDVSKMVPEFQNFDSPFIAIMREFNELNDRFLGDHMQFMTSDDLAYKQILVLHKQCENYIDTAFSNSHRFGISIKVNQSLLRIRQQLERIKTILSFWSLMRRKKR